MFTAIQGTDHTSPKYTFTVEMSLKAQPPLNSAKDKDYDSTDLQDTTSLPI
jgi:hypothetical protein